MNHKQTAFLWIISTSVSAAAMQKVFKPVLENLAILLAIFEVLNLSHFHPPRDLLSFISWNQNTDFLLGYVGLPFVEKNTHKYNLESQKNRLEGISRGSVMCPAVPGQYQHVLDYADALPLRCLFNLFSETFGYEGSKASLGKSISIYLGSCWEESFLCLTSLVKSPEAICMYLVIYF